MLVATNAGIDCVEVRHPPAPEVSLVSGGKIAGLPGCATTHADSVFVVLISGRRCGRLSSVRPVFGIGCCHDTRFG